MDWLTVVLAEVCTGDGVCVNPAPITHAPLRIRRGWRPILPTLFSRQWLSVGFVCLLIYRDRFRTYTARDTCVDDVLT